MQQGYAEKGFPELADFFSAQIENITKLFIKAVKHDSEIDTRKNPTYQQLTDHLPDLFAELNELLRYGGSDKAWAEVKKFASKHGGHRWKQGYKLDELLREIEHIRQILVTECFTVFEKQHAGLNPEITKAARKIIHEFFNDLSINSVRQFIDERDQEVRSYSEKLKEANRNLEQVNEQLRKVDESRLRLTRTISHELRNILHSMSIAGDLLGQKIDEAVRQETLLMLNRNITDMSALLGQLLDYSILIARQEQIFIESFELQTLYDELVFAFKPMAEAKGLRFEVEYDPRIQMIKSDRLKIKQITSNLISNAIKYTKEGYIRFCFRLVDAKQWAIFVEDTGMGIAPADLNTIFDEFHRVKAVTGVHGLGLGLAITKQLVKLLGGQIKVHSEVSRGSCFQVTLPINL
jgi:signal transduction histidine kinase